MGTSKTKTTAPVRRDRSNDRHPNIAMNFDQMDPSPIALVSPVEAAVLKLARETNPVEALTLALRV
jgi:hypothetical protein